MKLFDTCAEQGKLKECNKIEVPVEILGGIFSTPKPSTSQNLIPKLVCTILWFLDTRNPRRPRMSYSLLHLY